MKIEATYRIWQLGALICAAMGTFASLASAAEPWGNVRPRPEDFLGTLSCTSASCHGGAETWGPTGLVSHQEYLRWLGTEVKYVDGRRRYDPRARLESANADPHALAAWRISQPRFQEVLRKASLRPDGSTDATMYQRCAACHDPMGIATSIASSTAMVRPSAASLFTSLNTQHSQHAQPHGPAHGAEEPWDGPITMVGISCESCHGGGKHWITTHFRRDVSRESLIEQGMIDTKNLFVRARQCASCHIGSADQDMNHDMIAAGHPPLRFEHASYEALLVGKHWNDVPQRVMNPNYEVQLWAAGRIAAADAALALLEGRARRAMASSQEPGASGQAPWPEFAESNCFACHQTLRSLEGRTSSAVASNRPVGVAQWQTWNLALTRAVVAEKAAGQNVLPPASLSEALKQLRAEMEGSFSPPPEKIMKLAASARAALQAAAQIDSNGQVLDRQGRPLDVAAVLGAESPSWNSANWDEACQQVAILAAASRSLKDASRMQASPSDWTMRLSRVSHSLRFTRSDREWPGVFEPNAPVSLSAAGTELEMLRRELINKSSMAGNVRP
jgi:hypothetical protein